MDQLRYLLFLLVAIVVFRSNLTAQERTNNLFGYSFKEHHYNEFLIGFDSYDLLDIQPLSFSRIENEQLTIDSLLFDTNWLFNHQLFYPSDSYGSNKMDFNRFNNRTTIHVLKESNLLVKKSLFNQVNDPGLNVLSENRTPNVEYVKKSDHLSFKYKTGMLFSHFTYDEVDFSRTNALVYDRVVNNRLLARTKNFDNDRQIYQRSRMQSLMLRADYRSKLFSISTLINSSNSEAFIWYPKAGIDLPVNIEKKQLSNRFTIGKLFELKTLISEDYAESLLPSVSYPIEVNSKRTHQILSAHISKNITLMPFYVIQKWNDTLHLLSNSESEFGVDSKINFDESLVLNLSYSNLDLHLSSKAKFNSFNLLFSHRNYSKKKNGFNITTLSSDLIFDPNIADNFTINNSSDFIYRYSKIGLVSNNKTDTPLSVILDVNFTHFWNYVYENVEYTHQGYSKPYKPSFTIEDLKNYGVTDLLIKTEYDWSNNLKLELNLSSEIILYGGRYVERLNESLYSFLLQKNLYYKVSQNSSFILNYRYSPARYIHSFKTISTRWPPPRIKPIHLLNFSFQTSLFNDYLNMGLTIRNLLNSTESFNTNGQYYNMSIMATATLNIH